MPAGCGPKEATASTSPVRSPIAGGVVRLSPDFKQVEVVADGYRNPFGFDFNGDGELFTFDSDNERCVALPWYEPTRLYHVIPGGHTAGSRRSAARPGGCRPTSPTWSR